MLFGPSDSLDFPVCLSACDSHRFDSYLDELCIGKCFRQNKYFLGLLSVVSVSKSARSITNDIFTSCDRVKPEHGMNGIAQHCPQCTKELLWPGKQSLAAGFFYVGLNYRGDIGRNRFIGEFFA
jgi:hypothetical protein